MSRMNTPIKSENFIGYLIDDTIVQSGWGFAGMTLIVHVARVRVRDDEGLLRVMEFEMMRRDLTHEEIRAHMEKNYPGYEVIDINIIWTHQ